MRKVLLQLDTSSAPSVFDRVVAVDAGTDEVFSYGGVLPEAVRDLVHGCIFTRGPKDLHHTAIFVGGSDIAAGERVFAAVRESFIGPFQVSAMLDSNGSNTTAVAAVLRLEQTVGDLRGRKAVVLAGSGPVGLRAAGLLAQAGAEVIATSRRPSNGTLAAQITERFGGIVRDAVVNRPSDVVPLLDGADVLLSAGPAGVALVDETAWRDHPSLRAIVDLNAVPPLGIGGVAVSDNAAVHGGITAFGALGVGGLKMKVHRACIGRLFERNDRILDAEAIAGFARDLIATRG